MPKALQPAEKLKYLSELMVFQDLTSKEMEELNRITTMSTVRKGRVFYRPEEPGEVLFILKEGRVQLYRISPEGKKLVITTLGPHTLFGEMALLGTKMHNTFAEAVDDCLICIMSRTDLERLILNKPQVALRILEITGPAPAGGRGEPRKHGLQRHPCPPGQPAPAPLRRTEIRRSNRPSPIRIWPRASAHTAKPPRRFSTISNRRG